MAVGTVSLSSISLYRAAIYPSIHSHLDNSRSCIARRIDWHHGDGFPIIALHAIYEPKQCIRDDYDENFKVMLAFDA